MLMIAVTSIMSQLPIILLWYYQVQPMRRLMSTATLTPHYGMWATLFFIMVIELVVVAITITTLFQELRVLQVLQEYVSTATPDTHQADMVFLHVNYPTQKEIL